MDDDYEEERRARDEAIRRSRRNADPEWYAQARQAMRHVAHTHTEFISDALWETGLAKPREARALGSVMVWARQRGMIEPTNRMRQSKQGGCHLMPRRIWRSLVYGQQPKYRVKRKHKWTTNGDGS